MTITPRNRLLLITAIIGTLAVVVPPFVWLVPKKPYVLFPLAIGIAVLATCFFVRRRPIGWLRGLLLVTLGFILLWAIIKTLLVILAGWALILE